MSIKIKEKNENKLLKRTEIKAELGFAEKATPSNEEVAKMISAETKKPAENIVVKSIYTKYGDTTADVEAYVYDSKEDKEHMEPTTKAMKDKAAAAAKASAKAAEEAKAEEKPAEAPKEEVKKEEKAEG